MKYLVLLILVMFSSVNAEASLRTTGKASYRYKVKSCNFYDVGEQEQFCNELYDIKNQFVKLNQMMNYAR